MKKIDIHNHTVMDRSIKYACKGINLPTPEQLKVMFDRMGIEKGNILPEVCLDFAYEAQSNVDALSIVEKYPDMFYWFCNIDPRMGVNGPAYDLSDFLQYYKALGAKGVGELSANMYFDDPRMENLLYHCEKNDMPVLFHMDSHIGHSYGIVDELGLHRLEKELINFPKLKFLAHSQIFWSEISADVTEETRGVYPTGKVTPGRVVELMRSHQNLCCDLSANSGYNALTRDPEFGYSFIEEFQDRLYFGTDICSVSNDMKLTFWLDNAFENKKITETAYRKISRENALALLER